LERVNRRDAARLPLIFLLQIPLQFKHITKMPACCRRSRCITARCRFVQREVLTMVWKNLLLALLLILPPSLSLAQDSADPGRDTLIAAVMQASAPTVLQSLPSADSTREAVVTAYDCVPFAEGEYAYEILDIIGQGDVSRIMVTEQLRNCQGLGAFGLRIEAWSPDGKLLLYSDAREGQPDGGGFTLWLPPVYRFHLNSGETDNLGGVRFSPDRRFMATWTADGLGLLTAAGDEIMTFAPHVSGAPLNQLFWLPDGASLIYVQFEFGSTGVARTVVVHVDALTLKQTLLLETGS
jgi:hypothetical protein